MIVLGISMHTNDHRVFDLKIDSLQGRYLLHKCYLPVMFKGLEGAKIAFEVFCWLFGNVAE